MKNAFIYIGITAATLILAMATTLFFELEFINRYIIRQTIVFIAIALEFLIGFLALKSAILSHKKPKQ
jgi:hypothetical protein